MRRILQDISIGERFIVRRAQPDEGGPSVIVKSVRPDRRSARNADLLVHEWNVLRRLESPHVVHALGLEQSDDGPILITEDVGPKNLCEVLDGNPVHPARFLDLAIPMVEAVAGVHQRGYIHRDICPANFVVGENPTLVDFETATTTTAFTRASSSPDELVGTLAYIAPEQTGRMNRSVDHRTDLYSLGATFYEMLTGAPPFRSRNPLELLVVELLSRSIDLLPAPLRELVETAAGIGFEFGLGLLTGILGRSPMDVSSGLSVLVNEGLIVPVSGEPRFPWAGGQSVELSSSHAPAYRFVHDRVQEAAYQRLGEPARKDLHARIGRWLLANVPAAELERATGGIADQLNLAVDCLTDDERVVLAGLDHRAGRLARAAAAFDSALGYFRAGLSALPSKPCEVWFALVRDAAEGAAFVGEHALCDELVHGALAEATAPAERASLYHVLAQSKVMCGDHAEAIHYEREALRLLGLELPVHASEPAALAERERVRAMLRRVSDEEILDAPIARDDDQRVLMRMLVGLAAATWFSDPELFQVVACRAVELTMRGGIAVDSPFAFSAYAIALAMTGEYDDALRFGRIGVALAERTENPAQLCRALMVLGGHINPWRSPLEESIPLLRRAFAVGRPAGEVEYAAYALANLVFALWFRGASPNRVLDECSAALEFYRRIGHAGGIEYVSPFVQAARCLTGQTHERASFDDEHHEEARFLADASTNGLALAVYHLLRLQACYLLGENERARDYAVKATAWLPYMRTIFLQADHALYSALAIAAQDGNVVQLREHVSRLEHWARGSPTTFGHKYELVSAELARVEHRSEAGELFRRAIASAQRHGCTHEVALCHERYARYCAALGDRFGFDQNIAAAATHYDEWGATAKVSMLVEEVPALQNIARAEVRTPSAGAGLRTLDLEIVLKAAETLTSELTLDRLLPMLMRLSLSASSAERAVLVLDGHAPAVRAEVSATGEVLLARTPLDRDATIPRSIIDHVMRTGEVVVLEDAARDSRFSRDPHVAAARIRSVLAVPLRKGHDSVGALYFENNLATGAFTEERVNVFRVLSAQMAVALHNSLLFEERRCAEQRLRVLADASKLLAESIEYEQVLTRIGRLLVPALSDWSIVDILEGPLLQAAGLYHENPERLAQLQELREKAPVDLDSPQPQAQVLRTREPMLVPHVNDELIRLSSRDEQHRVLIETLSPRSMIVLPLIARGRSLGALTLVRCHADRPYDHDDLELAQELAHRIAMALDNARLHRDLEREIQLRAQRDRYLRMVCRQVPGTIYATDRDLRLTYAVGYLPHIPSVSEGQAVGKSVYDFTRSTDPAEPANANHLAALRGDARSFETMQYGRWFAARVEPLRDSNGEVLGVVGAALDVTERREAQEQLARNEARLAEAQRVAHVGSFEWDIESNVVTWTDELHRIYGLEPGEFTGTLEAFLGQVYPDDLELTKNVVSAAIAAPGELVYDHRIVRRDGGVRVLHTRGDVITKDDGTPVRLVGTCWDVTELTEATAARERSLSLLHATVEATGDGILVVDLAGRITLVNERMRVLWGLGPEALVDEASCIEAMAVQVDDPDELRLSMAARRAAPAEQRIDIVRLTNGRVYERFAGPQRVGDAVVGIVWSYRDVSERERLLRRALFLGDATRLLASLDVERALDAVAHLAIPYLGDACAIDLFDNGGPRRLLSLSRDERHTIAGTVHPAVLAGSATIYRAQSTSHLGVPLITKAGSVGAITFAASPGHTYTQADLELAQDLGQRAALSIENARLYQRAREAVHRRDEFLAIASHEIRGPITSLHLAVEMLAKGEVPPAAQTRAFNIIERSDRRLGDFVDNLLDLSRIRAGTLGYEFGDVDFVALVRNVANQLATELARSGSTLSVAVEGPVRGEWDELRLGQIVTNLLSNAIKFGQGKPINVRVFSRSGRAILVVKDRGIGIAPELQTRIFQPFERAVSIRHYGGLGLGLYIVSTIVQAFGGSIHIDSAPGEGATFTVELPLARTS